MHLVDQQRAVHRRLGGALLPPRPVTPAVARQVVHLAVGAGTGLGVKREGVGLPHRAAVRAGDDVLVAVVHGGVFRRVRPHAVPVPAHVRRLPAVEVAGQRHMPRMGRPDAERIALRGGVCAQICIRAVPAAAAVQLHLLGHDLSPFAAPYHIGRADGGETGRYACLLPVLYPFCVSPSINTARLLAKPVTGNACRKARKGA